MDLFFNIMRQKQRILVDVGQAAKVESVQVIVKSLLDLPEAPRLMMPSKITNAETRHDISAIDWKPMDSSKLLSSYGFTKENALAHEPIPIAFMLPEDTEPIITPLSIPKPIPEEFKSDVEMTVKDEPAPSS